MRTYCQLEKQTVKFESKYKLFFNKMGMEFCPWNIHHFVRASMYELLTQL